MNPTNHVLWCQISSGPSAANRHASYGITRGWSWFADQHIWPWIRFQRDIGVDMPRVLLHQPFGRTKTGTQKPMALDEYQQALRHDHLFYVDQFVEVFRPMVADGVEVIAYLGRPENTRSIIEDAVTAGRTDNVLREIWRALRLPLECDCSIAFDNMTGMNSGGLDDGVYAMAKSLTQAYVEATSQKDGVYDFEPAIIRWPLFRRRHVEPQHPSARDRFALWDDREYRHPQTVILATPREYNEAAKWFAEVSPSWIESKRISLGVTIATAKSEFLTKT